MSTGRTDSAVPDIGAGAGGWSVDLVGAGLNLTFTANHSTGELFGEIEPEPVR